MSASSEQVENQVIEGLERGADLCVGQIAQSRILECPPGLSIREAARRMHNARCSSILVMERGKPVGIWTERDALSLDMNDDGSFERPIRDSMKSPVKTMSADAGLNEVAVRFRQEGVRHFLIVGSEGEPVGVVSQTDLVTHQGVEHYLRLRKVKSVLKRSTITVADSCSVAEAARLMRQERLDAVIVDYAAGDHGIITERDIVRLIAEERWRSAVGEVASRPLIAVPEGTSLYRVRNLLLESRVRHIGVTAEDGGTLSGVVSFTDIISGIEFAYVEELQNALRERDQALQASRRSLHLAEKIIESSLEGVVITRPDGTIESVNPAFTRLTGYTEEEVVGRNPSILSSGRHGPGFYDDMWRTLVNEGHWQGEIWNRRKNGEVYPELLTITAIMDEEGGISHYAAIFSDITELKENEERIRSLAYYDPLTGLPNRRLFEDRLNVAVARAHRNATMLAVMFIDLDRFKRINDSLGHSVGDRVLQEVSRRILSCLREDDTVARMGGDEFVCVLSTIADPDDAAGAARRVQQSLSRAIDTGEEDLVVTSSIGISIYPDDGQTPDALIRNADAAMYRAKDTGRDSYQLYTPAMNARSLEHLAMENGMRRALERKEFELYYQPIIDASSGALKGAEALLRWHHPEMGVVPPSDFIPLAEETGLIIPMGGIILEQVCLQLRQWQDAGKPPLTVAVNISARQFGDGDFLGTVQSTLERTKLPPSSINIELTESMLMDDAMHSIRLLDSIRRLGIDISVDDFGIGYSSLNYLRRFPIDKLKIDRTFIRDIARNEDDAAIVSAIVELAHSLRMKVVAEGVENEAQAEILRNTGCDLLQGYYFGVPAPAAKFAAEYLR